MSKRIWLFAVVMVAFAFVNFTAINWACDQQVLRLTTAAYDREPGQAAILSSPVFVWVAAIVASWVQAAIVSLLSAAASGVLDALKEKQP